VLAGINLVTQQSNIDESAPSVSWNSGLSSLNSIESDLAICSDMLSMPLLDQMLACARQSLAPRMSRRTEWRSN
jgi:hypothetical protein